MKKEFITGTMKKVKTMMQIMQKYHDDVWPYEEAIRKHYQKQDKKITKFMKSLVFKARNNIDQNKVVYIAEDGKVYKYSTTTAGTVNIFDRSNGVKGIEQPEGCHCHCAKIIGTIHGHPAKGGWWKNGDCEVCDSIF